MINTDTLPPGTEAQRSGTAEQETFRFINRLCEQTPAHRRYYPLSLYVAIWLVCSVAYLIVLAHNLLGPRDDLASRLVDPMFLLTVGCNFAASVIFGYSSMVRSIPCRKNIACYVGLGILAGWAGTVIYSMLVASPGLLHSPAFFQVNLEVFLALLAGGIVPLVGLWLLVRRLVPMQSFRVAVCMSLASFPLSVAVLSFYQFSGRGYDIFLTVLIPLMLISMISCVSVAPTLRYWIPNILRYK